MGTNNKSTRIGNLNLNLSPKFHREGNNNIAMIENRWEVDGTILGKTSLHFSADIDEIVSQSNRLKYYEFKYPKEQNTAIIYNSKDEILLNDLAYSPDLAISRFIYLYQGSRRDELIKPEFQELFEHILFRQDALTNLLSASNANYDLISKFIDECLNDSHVMMTQINSSARSYLKILKHPEKYSTLEKENSKEAFNKQQQLAAAYLFFLKTKQRLLNYAEYAKCKVDQNEKKRLREELKKWRDGSHNLAVVVDPMLTKQAALIHLAGYSKEDPNHIKEEDVLEMTRSLRIQNAASGKKVDVESYKNPNDPNLLHEALGVSIRFQGQIQKHFNTFEKALKGAPIPPDIKWSFSFPLTTGISESNGKYYEFSWLNGSLKENGLNVEQYTKLSGSYEYVYSLFGKQKIQFKEVEKETYVALDHHGDEIRAYLEPDYYGGKPSIVRHFDKKPYFYIPTKKMKLKLY